MAIDTQEKRRNVVGIGRPWLRTKLPGEKDQQWRIASGNAYGGNAIGLSSARQFTLAAISSSEKARLPVYQNTIGTTHS